jgi:plastocyanin
MRQWTKQFGFCRATPLHLAVVAAAGMMAGAAIGAAPHVISQKNREFKPGEIAIQRGEALQFVNDDGDLLHHIYPNASAFKFDSGDQQPGSKFDVTFTVAGDFTVLCAIHPKMKLLVHVK